MKLLYTVDGAKPCRSNGNRWPKGAANALTCSNDDFMAGVAAKLPNS